IEQHLGLKPESATLRVRTEPPGALVMRGNENLGTTPLEVKLTLDSPVALKIKRRDYATVERTLPASAFTGEPRAATLNRRLQPLPRGELTLNAIPWAHVTIDGETQRDTPLSKLPIAAGSHQVKLTCPPTGHETRFAVTIEPGKETRKIVDLRGAPTVVE